jgi:hypothetical protein
MGKQVLSKNLIITISFLAFLFLFYFLFFKPTEAQVCVPLNGYVVWPGTWESGRIPMASTSQYYLAPSSLFVSGSNVGIGYTSPVYPLQVNGDISGTRLCIGSDCRNQWPSGTLTGSGLAGQVTFWTASTSLGGDNNLFWDNINKRLGIGTTTPQTSLHVIGSITANNFSGRIEAVNVVAGQFGGVSYSFPDNVGIGTTAPSYKLDVNGALRLQPTYLLFGDNGVIYYDIFRNKFMCVENGSLKYCIIAGIPSGAYIAFPDASPRSGFTYTGVTETVATLTLYWFQKQ